MNAQIITTFAGIAQNGQYNFSPDGTLAVNASLPDLTTIKADAARNIYMVDDNKIRKIDAVTGAITIIAGDGTVGFSGDGGPALNASFHYLSDFCIDKQGNIYICDNRNNRIRKVDAVTHIVTTIAGNGTSIYTDSVAALSTGLPKPTSIDIDNNGNLYIAISDYAAYGNFNYIYKMDAVSSIITKIAGNGTGVYNGNGSPALQTGFYITGMRVDAAGNLYFADPIHNSILKLTTSTDIINTIAGTGTIQGEGCDGDGGLAINAKLNIPLDISFDKDSNLLISSEGCNLIRRINTTTGIITTVAGTKTNLTGGIYGFSGDGGVATCALLHIASVAGTTGITSDKSGNFYFVDQDGSRIRKVDNSVFVPANPKFSITTPVSNICLGQIVNITSTISNAGDTVVYVPVYQWFKNGILSEGDNANYISNKLVNRDSIYSIVETTNDACQPVTVKSNVIGFTTASSIIPTVNITASDTAVCPGKTITLSTQIRNAGDSTIYQWQINGKKIGENNNFFLDTSVTNGDKINCVVTANTPGCPVLMNIYSDTINLSVKPMPVVTLLPVDTTINVGSSVQLEAVTANDLSSYQWMPSSSLNNAQILNPVAMPLETTRYSFTAVSTNGCSVKKDLIVKLFVPVYIPTAFTPNGDGKNDLFRIPSGTTLDLKEFSIFDRWGNRVFITQNISAGWDGKFKGKPEATGVYVYNIVGSSGGKQVQIKGTVTLLR
jgi:gliding motility-associated-like protein